MERLPSIKDNFPAWYNDVVLKAELADYSPVKGCMIIRPYGYALWENIQEHLNEKIKAAGVQNAYFPLLIPERFIKKEAEHVEGFSPETAVVTHAGGKKLDEPLVLRPTSETIMYDTFSRWISSYRDLPLKINQWANIIRWEMRTRLFLRTTEFLWQEGHTVHAAEQQAQKEVLDALARYHVFSKEFLAVDTVQGEKTPLERFPGADATFSIEGLMRDGKAVQMGTSHNLGQRFAKSFDITFLDKDNKRKYAWQTSWGVSTRLIGALIMAHGDEKGLILPPKIAPFEVVVVPIYKTSKEKKEVLSFVDKKIMPQLRMFRVVVDSREQHTPGWKFNQWELKGAPLRIEVGPRDTARGAAIVANRLTDEKSELPAAGMEKAIGKELAAFHASLYERNRSFAARHTYEAGTLLEITGLIEKQPGWYRTGWCGEQACEQKIGQTEVTIRNMPFAPARERPCAVCGKKGKEIIVAKAY